MKVRIQYCTSWGYLPRATGLAARIKQETGVVAELQRGSNGVFDVWVDDRQVFSRYDSGRFPDAEEILKHLR